jgi:P27 family predicted phage terminase small subunit
MRGRKPRPLQAQINEGDPRQRGKGKIAQRAAGEPKATTGLPPCPRHLNGRSRSSWKFWSEELAGMGLDKRPDGPMLEGACRAYARAVEADLILDREGLIVTDTRVSEAGESITTKKHPAVEISNRSWLIVKAFCSEFGLSPVSRTRLAIAKKPQDSMKSLMEMLSKPRDKKASPMVQ